jgi:hypothetical protein
MCKFCGYKYGSTKHQLYWLFIFLFSDFKKFKLTFYHLFNRKAYRKWFNEYYYNSMIRLQLSEIRTIDRDAPDDYIDYLVKLEPLEYLNMRYGLK